MDMLWQDIRYSLRSLARTPAFAAAAILSLALGIGANTTMFTLVSTLFLNPLPVEKSAELLAINTLDTRNTTGWGNILPLSYPNLIDIRDQNQSFERLAGYSSVLGLSLSVDDGEPERIFCNLVTAGYFPLLGIRPAAGRFFRPEEEQTPGTHPVAVIGHGLWQRRFAGAPDIVGRTIRLNSHDFTIVGIAPRGFLGITTMIGPEIWLPAMMASHVLPSESGNWLTDRAALTFQGVGRLKPGVTQAQADANLAALASALAKAYPTSNEGRGLSVLPITEATIFPGARQGLLFGSLVLMSIVGLVLLIACSNVANLLLARASSRQQELATRLALGAGRTRLVRQMLTESLIIALAGGALGLLLALWGKTILWSFRPAAVAHNFVSLHLDERVLLFALVLSLVTGAIFGVLPALRASRPDLVESLKDGRTVGGARRGGRLRQGLVIAQVTLSLVALAIAALFLRGIQHAARLDPGFDASRLAVLSVNPAQAGFDRARTDQFYRDVRDRLTGVGGIESVTWAKNLPLWAQIYRGILVDDQPREKGRNATLTLVNTVDLGYFSTLGVPITRGRDFTDADRAGAAPVVIINDTMAARYWPNQDPVGRRVRFDDREVAYEVIGVVRTTTYQMLGEAPQPCLFLPLRQNASDALVLYVRASGDPAPALALAQRTIRGLGAEVPIEFPSRVRDLFWNSLWMVQFAAGLLAVFGLIALGLASVGIYGVMAYAVTERRREIGLRMALGARPSDVRRLVVRQGMTMALIGLALGAALALLAARALGSMLFGLSAADPVSFLGAAAVLATVALVASLLPAYRASRLDPLRALRE